MIQYASYISHFIIAQFGAVGVKKGDQLVTRDFMASFLEFGIFLKFKTFLPQ